MCLYYLIKEPAVESKPEALKPSVAPVKQKMPLFKSYSKSQCGRTLFWSVCQSLVCV